MSSTVAGGETGQYKGSSGLRLQVCRDRSGQSNICRDKSVPAIRDNYQPVRGGTGAQEHRTHFTLGLVYLLNGMAVQVI